MNGYEFTLYLIAGIGLLHHISEMFCCWQNQKTLRNKYRCEFLKQKEEISNKQDRDLYKDIVCGREEIANDKRR